MLVRLRKVDRLFVIYQFFFNLDLELKFYFFIVAFAFFCFYSEAPLIVILIIFGIW